MRSDDPTAMGLAGRLRERFHSRRAELFLELMAPEPGSRLLDLGGGDGSLAARIASRVPLDVTVADSSADNRAAVVSRGFRHVLLEESAPLPFSPGEFDVVLCNSVIEHVTMSKDACSVHSRVPQDVWMREARLRQRMFAGEIARLAASWFVQTPHRHFPIEQHVHLPLLQYLTHNNLCRVVRWTDAYWVKSCHGTVDWELLSEADMRACFPDANITVERFAGIPKSIIAWCRGAGR